MNRNKYKNQSGFTHTPKQAIDKGFTKKSNVLRRTLHKPDNSLVSGFTLIELLVVISIISFISSIMAVAFNNARIKARDTKRIADVNQLAKAVALYVQDNNGQFPNDDASNSTANDWSPAFKAQMTPYLSKLPIDPQQGSPVPFYGSYRMTWSPNGVCNGYYVIWTYLEDPNNPLQNKSTCGFGYPHYFVIVDKY